MDSKMRFGMLGLILFIVLFLIKTPNRQVYYEKVSGAILEQRIHALEQKVISLEEQVADLGYKLENPETKLIPTNGESSQN